MLVFTLLLFLRRKNLKQGLIFLTFAVAYSLGRFFIEGLRTDSLYIIGDLRTAQFVSILVIVIGVIIMVYRTKTTTAHYIDTSAKKTKTPYIEEAEKRVF